MSIFTEWPTERYPTSLPPLSIAPQYDKSTALALSWAMQLAYETGNRAKLERIVRQWDWDFLDIYAARVGSILPMTSAKGFIAGPRDLAILAFSGTDPMMIDDWIIDFTVHRNADGVHEGFHGAVQSIWKPIAKILGRDGEAGTRRILITGHSLGGALAVLAAHRLIKEGVVEPERLLGVYTYGMPRVGDAEFAANYAATGDLERRTYRFIHGEDIVPQVPPMEEPFNFRHVGRSLQVAHGGLFQNSQFDAIGATPFSLTGIFGALRTTPLAQRPKFPGDPLVSFAIAALPPAIRDHLPDGYLRACGATL
uniref:Lipase 1307 n=1 Tax=uncultured organism TaxID=155900 RepID=A0A385HDN4_9ZZZZ|nr:lipase 1307 [uncultured organism]